MPKSLRTAAIILSLALFSATSSRAQVATGTPPYGSFGGGPEVINLGNLNSHIVVPIVNKAGRGTNFTYDLAYDNSIWYPVTSGSTTSWQPVPNNGWLGETEVATGYISYTVTQQQTCPFNEPPIVYEGIEYIYTWAYHDAFGVVHNFPGTSYQVTPTGQYCTSSAGGFTAAASDGSGWKITTNGGSVQLLVAPYGRVMHPPINLTTGTASYTDRNGNQLTVDSSGDFYDTLSSSSPALTVTGTGTATSPLVFSYAAPSGSANCPATGKALACFTVSYTNYTLATNFGISGVHEYKSSAAVPLVTSVVLPDGSKYTLTYEPTPSTPSQGACTPYSGTTCTTGRPASVTLPTGGVISYTYYNNGGNFPACTTGNNGIFSDGSASCLLRTTPDGTWTYTRSQVSGTHWQTLVSDATTPTANQTLIDFRYSGGNYYETSRKVYQGAQGGTLLETLNTCYDGAAFPCLTNAITFPITQISTNPILPNGSGNLQSEYSTYFDTSGNGNVTETDGYDWGIGQVGSLIRKTSFSYAPLTNITSFPSQITVKNSSLTVVSQTNYNYGDTVTATSGTPQHTTPPGARGNLLSVNYYTTGSAYLTRSMTYFDTGNAQTVTDVNGAQTTYSYAACGNSFPTNVAEPLSLSRSMAWSCAGGVQTSVTDENTKISYTNYGNDLYYWRPDNLTDPLGNVLAYYYQPNSTYGTPWEVDQFLDFNGSQSRVSNIQYMDGLGRTYVDQHCQSPACTALDSVSYTFDSNGRPYSVSMPCSIGYAGTCPNTTAKTTTTYDALNRPSLITDGGNGTVTYTYNQNDVLIAIGPAPTGENPKRRQLEYDGLGRLTSVCELTTVSGSGSCGQTNAATGFWTKYSYDALGNLTGVTQNAQATSGQQTRSYSYDLLSRLTSESNPESGSRAYTYDTDSTCGTSNGDLVKRTDAVGNVTCAAYDALHRPTAITYPSGTYASVTPTKIFVYDAATVNGVAMTNVKGRLAEASSYGPLTIPNPGFETSSNLPPPGWTPSGSTVSYDTTTPYAGARSLKVAATGQYGGAYGGNVQAASAGKSYTISGYAKSDGTCTADIQLQFLNSSQVYLGGAQAIAGTVTTWTYASATAVAPAGTAYVIVTVQNNTAGGAGVCEFDNISATTNAVGTDVGFSYTARGEVSDVYQATQNSGGYYHVSQTYWAHGLPEALSSNISGLPTITYGGTGAGLDGEGRITQVTASSGQNPVTAVSYNFFPASGPPQLTATYGSGDSDVYSLDPYTGRTTKYQFNVGSSSDTGTLTWNANGSLNQLAIADTLNSGGSQTCNYTHDELSRLVTANCGSAANQTFSYDAFGNISKSGSPYTFQPTYNSNNRMTSVGSFTPTYNANGNTLTDPSHTYSWDANGSPINIDSVSLTYDAFGRMVEQNRSGAYTQIVYAPTGGKLALMNGQTLQKAIIPLPGGGEAVFNASGILYYGHSDHLGNIRLGSTTSRGSYFDTGYAPFGESYATFGGSNTDPAFTSQRQDTVSGLFDFPAREYSNEGRWHSPDPAGLGAVDPTNPQSWNRYVYVLNNPLALVDPSGMGPTLSGVACRYPQNWSKCKGEPPGLSDLISSYFQDLVFLLAFTQSWQANPNCPNGDCANPWLPVYGNIGLGTLVGVGGGDGSSSATCANLRGKTIPANLGGGAGPDSARISFDNNGYLNGVSVYFGDRFNELGTSGQTIQIDPGTRVGIAWSNGLLPGSFQIGATKPVTVFTAAGIGASLSNVNFNGAFTVKGRAYGLPLTSGLISNNMNRDNALVLRATDFANWLTTLKISCGTLVNLLGTN